jgi:cytochrome oxidase Cu insertion factor (SCO1/SenC/PrrC family)
MNPLRRRLVSALPTLGALAASARWNELLAQDSMADREKAAPPMPALGSQVSLPAVTLLDGSAFQPSSANGHVTIVYWWASNCPFCALQSPEMQTFWQTHRDQVQMLALSVDKRSTDAMAYLQKKGHTFPSAWVSPEVHRVLPKPKGLPITLVVGRNGKVLQAEKGQMFPEDVAQLVSWLTN